MITIAKAAVDAVRRADKPEDLHHWLGEALRLEHSTVPLYLSAYFSIKPSPATPPNPSGAPEPNAEIAATLRSIVLEEMMHFAIVANVLTAVGGQPVIDDARMVPRYPGPLPMGVEAGLSVSVRPMSLAQCRVFMQIEEPEDPVGLPPDTDDVTTIGDFYRAITDKIAELGDRAFARPGAPQVLSPFFPADRLFPVTDAASATRAITTIVEQGEGTTTRPTVGRGQTELAHYYRFGEIVNGRRFVPDRSAPEGFSYSGAPVGLINLPAGIYPMIDDATLDRYRGRTSSTALQLATRFCTVYRQLLTSLQKTFSGAPDALDSAIGLMYDLRIAALALLETPDPDDPTHCLTPPWEYLR